MSGKSSTGSRKAPKRPAKPQGKPRKTTRSERSPSKNKIKSGWRRNVADRWVIHWRTQERLPWGEIVKRDGRSERALRKVVADYTTNVEEGDFAHPLDRDPIDLIEGMLSELAVMRDTMVGLVQTSEQESVIVAATREWRRLVKEVRDLLQGVGKLPRELGTMRHLVEVRELSDLLDRMLDRLEAGEITAAELRAQVAEWAGVKQIEAGDGEPVDADVVPERAPGG